MFAVNVILEMAQTAETELRDSQMAHMRQCLTSGQLHSSCHVSTPEERPHYWVSLWYGRLSEHKYLYAS